MALVRFYRANAFRPEKLSQLATAATSKLKAQGSSTVIERVDAEVCFYLEFEAGTTLAGLSEAREFMES